MRLFIHKLASLALAVVAVSSLSSVSSFAAVDATTVERICQPLFGPVGSIEPAVCTFSTVKGTGGNGCPIGTYKVTAASCSDQVTTYPDDACDGEPGVCVPPKTAKTRLKSVTAKAKPSLTVGQCISSVGDGSCVCTATDQETYVFGRKTCSGT